MRWSMVVVLCGCGVAELSSGSGELSDEAEQKERWSSADSPFLFSADLETRLDALPSSGEAAVTPWAGSYWPVSADTINFKWAGAANESPAKKYERAFGLTGVEDAVSRAHGIEGATSQRTCTSDAQCNARLGEVCGKRAGRTSGRCIPTWWGICHAWAPAAMLWPEPRVAVVRGGVRFEVQDLKALASLVHDRTKTKFASLRCNTAGSAFAFDRYGRPTDGACRDTNAGTYHVLLANYLGRFKQSFVIDRTVDDEVWNQPLRSFRVVSRRDVTAAQANALVGASGTTYRFNADARRLVHVVAEVRWIAESDPSDGYVGAARAAYFTRSDRHEYVLELDAGGRIIGGEWAGASRTAHPDFVWLPLGAATSAVAEGKIEYAKVKELVLESAAGGAAAPAPAEPGGAVTLAAGTWKTFGPFTVGAGALSVELSGTGDGDLYVRAGGPPSAALYDCRPWRSTSRETCTVRGPATVYVAVHAAVASRVEVRTRFSTSGSVRAGELAAFAVPVVAGRAVTVRTSAAGDVDLYVRLGSVPTSSAFDARAVTASGNEALRYVPRASGTLMVGVRGYAATSFTLATAEEP